MRLQPQSRLGVYEIVAPLGAGGMGEVYRARDVTLNRDVALKVLPESFANDSDRLARFKREAHVLAALNHPNIAAIYGFEEADGTQAIVLELVEGQTLADRLLSGPVSMDEALPIARQIAEGLEAAHEVGIVHRDLKPGNIKLRPDGTVKVLDFGLAKAVEASDAAPGPWMDSPTITTPAMTERGMILGTAAYMSPEQAKGRPVDRRTDVWAFGAVLYEMLTGNRAFLGNDVPDTLAAILSKEPDWQQLPAEASALRQLLLRCLKKDRKQRLQAIGDARIQIDEVMTGSFEPATGSHAPSRSMVRRAAPAALAALVASLLTGALTLWVRPERPAPNPPPVSRFEILPPPEQTLGLSDFVRIVDISPNGRYIASASSERDLAVRAIDGLDIRLLGGTEPANQPVFSPDSQWIGFFSGGTFRRVPTAGGAAITICQSGAARGASWDDDGSIVFATVSGEVQRISARDCTPTVLTKPDAPAGEVRHWYPSVLPGRRGILFTIMPPEQAESGRIAVLDLKTQQQKTLIHGGSQAKYVETGHLVYAAANSLRAVRFDLERLEVLSDPVTVVENLAVTRGGAAQYAFSRTGTLVYAEPRTQARLLVWVDRKGRESPIPAPPRAYIEPRLSPDGTRLAIAAADQEHDVWIWDLKRGGALTRLTYDPNRDQHPIWSADGRRIVFASLRSGAYNLYAQAADGTGSVERLTDGPDRQIPAFVLADGSGIIGTEITTHGDVVWFKRTSPGSSPLRVERLIHTNAIEYSPDVSPDGRFMAYQSLESGRSEIYVRPFPRVNDGKWQVSTRGGARPRWARGGRELFYLDEANKITAVPVQTTERAFVHGTAVTVLDTAYAPPFENTQPYDVSADGQRFVMIKEGATAAAVRTGVTVVLNWFEELKTKVP
jgi:serine/threonine-protein kinase